MNKFLDKFRLHTENEDFSVVTKHIENGVVFRGTNLWVLIFAIFVASLGLNINSTAVIIGAMLISPLMGPIMGIGLGLGINDVALIRKAILNYLIATGAALTTSTFFFLLSPLRDAHSEILARTAPTIYDVLIALFGGFAGIVATTSRHKGNVIPGVAIATALMPPLCTAGYGLATLQFSFFYGALYLFIINTVFIALATFIFVRLQHFPVKHLQNERAERMAKRIVWLIVLLTLLPSIYFGYDMVQRDRFTKTANRFITNEAHFQNDYLLSKKIDAEAKSISLIFGGTEILPDQIEQLRKRLPLYELDDVSLEIKQGFAYLAGNKSDPNSAQLNELTQTLLIKESQQKTLQIQLDSIKNQQITGKQIYAELKVQYPGLTSAIVQPSVSFSDSSGTKPTFLVLLDLSKNLPLKERRKLEQWLKVRLNHNNIKLFLQ